MADRRTIREYSEDGSYHETGYSLYGMATVILHLHDESHPTVSYGLSGRDF